MSDADLVPEGKIGRTSVGRGVGGQIPRVDGGGEQTTREIQGTRERREEHASAKSVFF